MSYLFLNRAVDFDLLMLYGGDIGMYRSAISASRVLTLYRWLLKEYHLTH